MEGDELAADSSHGMTGWVMNRFILLQQGIDAHNRARSVEIIHYTTDTIDADKVHINMK
jgi:hypothetical protein